MNEVLRPFGDFGAEELAAGLYAAATYKGGLLPSRNLTGVMQRYGVGPDRALESAIADQQEDGPVTRYAIVSSEEQIVGAAAINWQSRIYRQRFDNLLPPIKYLTERPVSRLNVTVKAWTRRRDLEYLRRGYQDIAATAREVISKNLTDPRLPQPDVWTIEPRDAPHFVHQAVREAGFVDIANGTYREAAAQTAGRPSILYGAALVLHEWDQSVGRLRRTTARNGQLPLRTQPVFRGQ